MAGPRRGSPVGLGALPPPRLRTVVPRGAIGVLGVAVVLAAATTTYLTTRDSTDPPGCREGQREDPERAAGLIALLSTTEARDLLRRAPRPLRLCFTDTRISTVATDGVYTLAGRATDTECAARLGHLLLHTVEGRPLPAHIDRSRPCDAVVREALEAEVRANALELRLRRKLGVPLGAPEFPFEREFWDAAPGERSGVLRTYFKAHPEGVLGVPGYVGIFTRRCEALRAGKKR